MITMAESINYVDSIVWPIYFHLLFDKIGFRHTLFIAAAIIAVMLLIANLLLKTRFPWQMPKKLIDREAFKEVPFVLTSLGYWILFLGFYVPFFVCQCQISNLIDQ